MRTSAIVAAAALSFLSLRAEAETARAWSAARASLPGEARIVVGIDVAAIQKTQLFATFYPQLRDKPEVAEALTLLRDACKIDPLAIIQGAVVALTEDKEDGAVYLSLANFDKARLASCFQRAHQAKQAKADAKLDAKMDAKLDGKADASAAGKLDARPGAPADDAAYTVKHTGDITEIAKGGETTYLGWPSKDVIVIPLRTQDKASLVKWMGGKGALGRAPLGKALARVNTAAALWGASDGDKELQPGITVKRVYGAVVYGKAALDADIHAVLPSAGDATTIADMVNQQIAAASKADTSQPGEVPPPIAAMLKAVKVTAASEEIVVKAHIGEQDMMALIAMSLSGGTGRP